MHVDRLHHEKHHEKMWDWINGKSDENNSLSNKSVVSD